MIPNVSEKEIRKLRAEVAERESVFAENAELADHFASPLRMKLLWLLARHDELCVSELSEILDAGMSAISHQLRLLREADIVATHKLGKQVCYRLVHQREIRKVIEYLDAAAKQTERVR